MWRSCFDRSPVLNQASIYFLHFDLLWRALSESTVFVDKHAASVWTKPKMERTRCVFKQKRIGVDRAWMLALALASLRPILSLAPYLHSWWICICLHVGMSQWVEFNSCNFRKGNVQAFMASELLFLVKRIGELCVLSVGLILSLLLFHLPLFFGFLLHVFADN